MSVEISPNISLVVEASERRFCERCGARLVNQVCTVCPPGLEAAAQAPPGPQSLPVIPPIQQDAPAEQAPQPGTEVVAQEGPLVIVAPPPPRRRRDIEVPEQIHWAADVTIDNGPARSR